MISLRPRHLAWRSVLLALIAFAIVTGALTRLAAQESAAASAFTSSHAGLVFAITNEAEANQIVVFWRATNGALSPVARLHTGGHGTGSPLDAQGAVILSPSHERLYVANPGSDEISVFDVDRFRLPRLLQVIASGGDLPLSLTLHDNVLYVLNAGTGGNLFGFRVRSDGTLRPLSGSSRMLTTPIGSPAQVQFNPEGSVLVVTHKATDVARAPENIIDTFTVNADGLASPASPHPSHGLRPFGFAFRDDGRMVVSEAFNDLMGKSAASSYAVFPDGTIQVISGSVGNGQTAACWVAITKNGRYAYVTNALSGTISSYLVSDSGSLTLLNGAAANTGMGSAPFDMDFSEDGQFLYALLMGTGKVAAFRVNTDGSLTPLGTDGGVPPMGGATGLAAF
jgi:6-phosphogluconolactonase (cycloisomerase 2 family)